MFESCLDVMSCAGFLSAALGCAACRRQQTSALVTFTSQESKINEMVSDSDDKQSFLTHRAAPERKIVLNSTVFCFVFLAVTTLIRMSEGLMFSSTLCI